MGLISKNCTGARRMALNMLSCRFWAELTRTLKKSKLRRKPNTTEVAVKPDKSTEKKKIHQHTTMLSLCFMFQGQLCISGVFIKHAEWYTKGDTFHFSFPFSYVFVFLSWTLIYHCEYKAWMGEEAGSHREKIRTIQQQRARKALLSACTAEAHVHIHWALKALGHSQRTVDLLIEWLAYSEPRQYTKSNVRSASITCVNT